MDSFFSYYTSIFNSCAYSLWSPMAEFHEQWTQKNINDRQFFIVFCRSIDIFIINLFFFPSLPAYSPPPFVLSIESKKNLVKCEKADHSELLDDRLFLFLFSCHTKVLDTHEYNWLTDTNRCIVHWPTRHNSLQTSSTNHLTRFCFSISTFDVKRYRKKVRFLLRPF